MYKRILIIGSAGSGKTTFSTYLGKLTNYPVVYLDKEYWQPNWQKPDIEEWEKQVNQFVEMDSWIIDGNYIKTLDIRLNKADMVIFINVNRIKCILSILKRIRRAKKYRRFDLPNGCEEKLDLAFLKWVWNFPNKYRPQLIKKINNYPNLKFMTFNSRKQAYNYIDQNFKTKS